MNKIANFKNSQNSLENCELSERNWNIKNIKRERFKNETKSSKMLEILNDIINNWKKKFLKV